MPGVLRLLYFLAIAPLCADHSLSPLIGDSSQACRSIKKDPVLISNLNKMILRGGQSDKQIVLCPDSQWEDWTLPGYPQDLYKKLSAFLDQSVTVETLGEIRKIITDYYIGCGRPLVIVEIPEQEVTSGELQIAILESKLGKLSVEGNYYTSSERIENYFHLEPGQPINERCLIQNISFVNRNPFRRANLVFAAGEKEGTTDVVIEIQDRRPFRAYAGTDNLGLELVGHNQWYAGFNWGNVFGLDHILSYQFTTSYNIHLFQAHTAEYIALLPIGHVLDVYGGYSEVHPPVPPPFLRNDGWSMQVSARYIIPLRIYRFLEQEFTFGADFKRSNNTFEFTEQFPTFGKNVNLAQFVLGYAGNYERNAFRLDFKGNFFCSPAEWLSDQTNADYASLRPGAVNRWVYFRGYLTYLQRLPKSFSLSCRVLGQGASEPLLPSEQLGLGGYETVRGYEERVFNVDNAFVFNLEARSPAMHLLKKYRPSLSAPDALQFLAFFDYGWGSNIVTVPGTEKANYLMGAGPGVRYTYEPYFTARLDWGIRLHKQTWFDSGNWSILHFNATASY